MEGKQGQYVEKEEDVTFTGLVEGAYYIVDGTKPADKVVASAQKEDSVGPVGEDGTLKIEGVTADFNLVRAVEVKLVNAPSVYVLDSPTSVTVADGDFVAVGTSLHIEASYTVDGDEKPQYNSVTVGKNTIIAEGLHTSTTAATKTVDYPIALADVTPADEDAGTTEQYVISLNKGVKVVVGTTNMPGIYDKTNNKVVAVSSAYKEVPVIAVTKAKADAAEDKSLNFTLNEENMTDTPYELELTDEIIALKEDTTATLTLVPALKVTATAEDAAKFAAKATYTYAPTGITKGVEFTLGETAVWIAEDAVVTVKAKDHTAAGSYGYINVAIAGADPVATEKSTPVTTVTSVATGEQTLKRASKPTGEANVYDVEFGLTVSVDLILISEMTIEEDTDYNASSAEEATKFFGTVTVKPDGAVAEENGIVGVLTGSGLVAGEEEGQYKLGTAGKSLTGTITITLNEEYFADAAKLANGVGYTGTEDISVTVKSVTKNGSTIVLEVKFITTAKNGSSLV